MRRAAVSSKSNECGPGLRNTGGPKTHRRCKPIEGVSTKKKQNFNDFGGGTETAARSRSCAGFGKWGLIFVVAPTACFLSELTDIQRISRAVISYFVAATKPSFVREILTLNKKTEPRFLNCSFLKWGVVL